MTDKQRSFELATKARIDVADLIDLQLSPTGLAAIEALAPKSGERICDVGCGVGQTVLQIAERVGPTGSVVGVDIEPKVLQVATSRSVGLEQVKFIEGDAETIVLPDQSFDGVFSRFGVMTFVNPIEAFQNFRKGLRSNGRLAFVCWRSLKENDLDYLPLRASGLERMVDLAPFSFEDQSFLKAILDTAGFKNIVIEANDIAVSAGGINATMAVITKVGALGRILRENPDLRALAEPRVRAELANHVNGDSVILKAATWIVTARA